MQSQEYQNLTNAFIAALERHENAVEGFDSACAHLLQQIADIVRRFRTPNSHRIRNAPVFSVRNESVPDLAIVIGASGNWTIKDRRLSSKEPLRKRVLTFQAGGLGYFPGSGLLCGQVAVVLSDGDYVSLLRQSKVSALDALLTLGMAVEASQKTLERIGDINRRRLDRLYLFAGEPDRWYRVRSDGTLFKIDVEEYLLSLMDFVFNPEGKVELF